jgi:tripartite-type tricarboxylate transporter receptor subunit TctC
MQGGMKMRTAVFLATAIAALLGPVTGAVAQQSYPNRPISIVIPFPPGGQVDTLARILLDKMKTALGQPIIIENVGGASGGIGTQRVVRSTPDGYTLVMGNWTSHVGGPAIYPVQFDVLKDLEPVAMLPAAPTIIVARQNLPANDLKEMVAWLKANPDKATAATVGAGSPGHVSGLYFQSQTGTSMQFVPYRGGGPANQDLLAGQVDMRIGAEASQMLPHVRGGRVKAFAVMAKTRWPVAPEIPTIDEAGVPGVHISVWTGLWAPKGTPKEIVTRLNGAMVEVLADEAVRKRIAELGSEVPARDQQTPEALAAFHKAEADKWWPIIKAANIKVE